MPNPENNPNPTPAEDTTPTPTPEANDGNNGGNGGNPPAVDENAIIKAYLEKKGINEDDLNKYVDEANKQKQVNPDVEKLQKDLQAEKEKNKKYEVEGFARKVREEVGFSEKNLEAVLTLAQADINAAYGDGKFNEDKLKEAFKNVVEKFPDLKGGHDGEGIKQIGAKGNNKNGADNGNKSKKLIASKKWNTFNY